VMMVTVIAVQATLLSGMSVVSDNWPREDGFIAAGSPAAWQSSLPTAALRPW
jgi:hypothetical protein